MWKLLGIVIAILAVVGTLLFFLQRHRFENEIHRYRSQITSEPSSTEVTSYDLDSLLNSKKLPEPVKQYFSHVLPERIPYHHHIVIQQKGSFNFASEPTDESISWQPLRSQHDINLAQPAFLWDATIRMTPLMSARVIDRYTDGIGQLKARLWGAITIAEADPSDELSQGELIRLLAEAAWYPHFLVISDMISWEAKSSNQAWVTLDDGYHSVSVLVTFNAANELVQIETDERYREVNGEQIPTPWQGEFTDYRQAGDFLIPHKAQVQWILPEGKLPYWKGEVMEIRY